MQDDLPTSKPLFTRLRSSIFGSPGATSHVEDSDDSQSSFSNSSDSETELNISEITATISPTNSNSNSNSNNDLSLLNITVSKPMLLGDSSIPTLPTITPTPKTKPFPTIINSSPNVKIDSFGFIIPPKPKKGFRPASCHTTAIRIPKKTVQQRSNLATKRVAKWVVMLKNWDSLSNTRLLKNRIRKGVPDSVRGR